MNRKDRAKQFMAFDALKGLQEELRKKEEELEQKRELSENTLEELEKKINSIDVGNIVKINYYNRNKYIEIQGELKEIDYIKKNIKVNEKIIKINDIVEIN